MRTGVSLTPVLKAFGTSAGFSSTHWAWVDTSPAKYLGANTSLIGEYLLKPLNTQKARASAVARTPHLQVHRPFGLTTRLGEPGEDSPHLYLYLYLYSAIPAQQPTLGLHVCIIVYWWHLQGPRWTL